MITLSRLNGSVVAINPDLITWIEVTPDTTVSMLGGDKINVREPLEEVIEKVIAFRRAVGEVIGHAPAREILPSLHRRDSTSSFRPSGRPSTPGGNDRR